MNIFEHIWIIVYNLSLLFQDQNVFIFAGKLQKLHPGVAVSIKTQQASRRILNTMRENILQMKSEGVLDDAETHKLEVVRNNFQHRK